jgi:uncharacterized membrane protein YidH (DUF202 family)
MSMRVAAASLAVTALVLVTVWLTDLSMERAILLAPVLVIGVAAVAGLTVFWGRVGWESLRGTRRPGLILLLVLAVVLVLTALTLLGVDLPRE